MMRVTFLANIAGLLVFGGGIAKGQELEIPDHNIAASFPGKVTRSIEKTGEVTREYWSCSMEKTTYALSIADRAVEDRRTMKQMADDYIDASDKAIKELGGRSHVIRRTPIRWLGHDGYQFTVFTYHPGAFAAFPSSVDVRMILVQRKSVLMTVNKNFAAEIKDPRYSATDGEAQGFFQSFRLLKPVEPIQEVAPFSIDGVWVACLEEDKQPNCRGEEWSFQDNNMKMGVFTGTYKTSKAAGQKRLEFTVTPPAPLEEFTERALYRIENGVLYIQRGEGESKDFPKEFSPDGKNVQKLIRPGDPSVEILFPFTKPIKVGK